MQALDLQCNPALDPRAPDPFAMSDHSSPNHGSSPIPENGETRAENIIKSEAKKETDVKSDTVNGSSNSVAFRRERPARACTQRAAARMQAAAEAEAAAAEAARRRKNARRKERLAARFLKEVSMEEEEKEEEDEDGFEVDTNGGVEENGEGGESSLAISRLQYSRVVTPLLGEPEPSQLPRWGIRSMWQLASILNFLNVFRGLLNIKVEFSVDEFETALISPNTTLADIHIPLLKAIPPVARMALGHPTWITVLCRKLKNWWHWVAEGDLPIIASHGTEVEAYHALDPGVRVVILKALCDIRVEQEDIRSYIDGSIKHGIQLSTFRKERLGGDSHGVSYWFEDDPIVGHRLYREIRKVEVKKGKGRNIPPIPHSSYQWETIATNFDEFLTVSEKLFSSKNRTEVSVGKKLKNDFLPEIEKVHKKKEKLLKKQHRQALMLDNMMNVDGLATGRSLRDRKPVTYTFDDYDRSINEAIKVTKKKQSSPDVFNGSDPLVKPSTSANGKWAGPSEHSQHLSFSAPSPNSSEDDDLYDYQKTEDLDRSNRRRQRPQRYSVAEFVEAVSDNDADFDSDDDIVGEVVYHEDYLRRQKKRRTSSSSEGDEEYNWKEENPEEEEEEEEEDDDDDDTMSTSEDSGEPRRSKTVAGRTRRETRSRFVNELQSGLRRSKRATRNHINFKQYDVFESDTESMKPEKSNESSEEHSYASGNADFSTGSEDSEEKNNEPDMLTNAPTEEQLPDAVDGEQTDPPEQANNVDREEEEENVQKRGFLDLNELAPGSGFDDGP
ncbi:DDT domain-containing protein DDR4-like [Andrographis paniculata]|uniref:DDT domain-containing protein DDR4-like n=1 Tax=Andrographis paniculata TaxID=175694 RepID=UPI0021E96849|nr:DDT domain-containing protein DDR4-like [Andrographis paniculata]XP_051133253.1 DDT domain-containing protein DDR4-like [Andrographis paniculata]